MSRTLASHLAVVAVLAFSVGGAEGAILFESATNVPDGQTGGYRIDYSSYLGARFFVPQTWQVSAVGGSLSGDDKALFAAIVRLTGGTGLPRTGGDVFNPTPFNSADVVAHKNFVVANLASGDVWTSMTATLQPGWYGLVFGSYQWGAYGSGGMSPGGQDLPGTSYFSWYSGTWYDIGSEMGLRFAVEGTPEPVSGVLLLGAGALLLRTRPRQR